MPGAYDLVIRDGFVECRGECVDVAIDDGTIVEVTRNVEGNGQEEIDAEGHLVSPAFVDAHKHIDRALSATGERKPTANKEPNKSPSYLGRTFDKYYEDTPRSVLRERMIENVRMAVASGTTHIRSHVAVDHSIGIDLMEIALEAREKTTDIVDLEFVPYTASGSEAGESNVIEAIEMCRDRMDADGVLLGGSVGLVGGTGQVQSIDRTIERWFDLATELDVDVDVHVTGRDSAGYYMLMKLAEYTQRYGYQGRVTAVHAWALAQLPDWWLDPLLEALRENGITVVTCYNSIREGMPVQQISEHGVTLAHGTDNDRDFVYANGNADPIEAAMIMSYKLIDDWHFDGRYRWSETNPALDLFWQMLTENGAAAVGIENEYGIVEGTPADLVVFDEPSRQWAIITQAARRAVIKDGTIVAENGTVCHDRSRTIG